MQWRSGWHCTQGKLGSKAIYRNGRNVSLPMNSYTHSQSNTSPITSCLLLNPKLQPKLKVHTHLRVRPRLHQKMPPKLRP